MTSVGTTMPSASSQTPLDPMERQVNVLLTSFAGLGLPRTLSLPVKACTTIPELLVKVNDRLPPSVTSTNPSRFIITTTSNKQLLSTTTTPIHSLLPSPTDTLLPLRLSTRLCGGKGGFGSQLRAAGGRMNSRKKRDQNQNVNGSNRNLQGHRLRVVAEAKRVGDALVKHAAEEEKAAAEKKKGRQAYMDGIEKTIEGIRSGKMGGDKGRLDAEYVEGKERAEEQTRNSVLKHYRLDVGAEQNTEVGMAERTGSESSVEDEERPSDGDDEKASSASSEEAVASSSKVPANVGGEDVIAGPAFYGWDEDDDDDDDDDEDDEEDE